MHHRAELLLFLILLFLPEVSASIQPLGAEAEVIALPQLHGARDVSLPKPVQICAWFTRVVEEQAGECEVQDEGVR